MCSRWYFLCGLILLANSATCDYQCTMKSFEVICSGLSTEELSQEVTVTLNKPDIITLNLTNSIIPTITKTTLQDFSNLQGLYVTNCSVTTLEDNAFSHSLGLKHLYLNNNTLTKFNVQSLPTENGVNVLDLSFNFLNDLSDFNMSHLPSLNLLNLADNNLSYLPLNLLEKLKEQNQLYVVVDNNPWDCSDSNWSEYLTESFIKAFCPNHSSTMTFQGGIERTTEESQSTGTTKKTTTLREESTTNIVRITEPSYDNLVSVQPLENDPNLNADLDTKLASNTDKECEKPNCMACSFYFCLWWLFCGIWIGVILGNIAKIKHLLFDKPTETVDSSTQYELSMSEQYMISVIHPDFKSHLYHRKDATAAPNTNEQTKEKEKQAPT